MFLTSFQGQQVIRGFSKKIHTQMCIASLFGRQREHNKVTNDKVEKNEWKDDDDEQKQIFYEEEKNNSLVGDMLSPLTPCPYLKGGVKGVP